MTQAAKLTAALLARKGDARPAQRPELVFKYTAPELKPRDLPQRTVQDIAPAQPQTPYSVFNQSNRNSFGHRTEKTEENRRIAMTVRLCPDDHKNLKIYCAKHGLTAQAVFLKALTRILKEEKDLKQSHHGYPHNGDKYDN